MKKKNSIVVTLIIVTLFLFGCQSQNNDINDNQEEKWIHLVISKDFGREIIFNKEVSIGDNDSIMKVLSNHLEIETKFNGTFVNGINGMVSTFDVKNGQQLDWFYYVNGISADVGANDYFLRSQDCVWWDYHEWGKGLNISSVIGQFPEPFVNGYQQHPKEVNILSTGNHYYGIDQYFEEENIAFHISVFESYDFEKAKTPTIVIMKTEDIEKNNFIKEINANYDKAGLFGQVNKNDIKLYNHLKEERTAINKNGALVQSFAVGLGNHNPLWLIVGHDEMAIQYAVDVLVKETDSIQWMNSFAVNDKMIIRLPMK